MQNSRREWLRNAGLGSGLAGLGWLLNTNLPDGAGKTNNC